MVATSGMLDKQGVIAYVGQNAARFGLDPAAVLSVANHEGLNTSPGSTWILPKENGFNFGPPSWFSGGAGSDVVKMQGSNAPGWSWTPAGLDYWLQQVAKSASGLSGRSAISAIVNGFERPREDLAAGEINNASADYTSFQQQIANAVGIGTGGATTDTTPAVTGTSAGVSGETGVQGQPALQSSATSGSNPSQPTSATLNFSDTIQHSIMQFLLVLVGLVLLLGGIYLIGSKS
jgi:hypothetical protein